jgi:hypothetical protein
VESDQVSSTLTLPPPRAPQASGRPVREDPGPIRVALTTALACLALGPDQERWGRFIGVPPVLLTVLGAGAELAGAIVNMASGQADSMVAIPLNLYLLGEGLFRFAGVLLSGRPVGSLAGYALRPIMNKSLRDR